MTGIHDKPPAHQRVGAGLWRQGWGNDTVLTAVYVLTNEHRHTEGLYRLPLGYAAEDLGWRMSKVEQEFARLEADDFIEYDQDARVCLIVNALRWQQPQNPNQIKAAVKRLESVPPNRLVHRFATLAATHAERFAERLRERFPEWFALAVPTAVPTVFPTAVLNTPSPSPSRPKRTAPTEVVSGQTPLHQIQGGLR